MKKLLVKPFILLLFISYFQIGIVSSQIDTKSLNIHSAPLSLRQIAVKRDGSSFLMQTSEGWTMKISFLNQSMIRIQMAPAKGFEPSLTERFGFVRTNWAAVPVKLNEQADFTVFHSDSVGVKVYKKDLRLVFLDAKGIEITGERDTRSWDATGGGTLRFSMPADEHFFGFGFQRRTMDCRGKTFSWKREYRSENATVPFFLSTKGYGFLSNNTWEHKFDFETKKDGYDITAIDGQLDFYFIRGTKFAGILSNYIQLTGAPQLIPKFGMGLYYICRYFEDQQGVLQLANTFRNLDIPCDMISLEPGWEDHSYSMKWKWSPERFPDPSGMIKKLNSSGFKFGLWESGIAPSVGYEDSLVRKDWYSYRAKTSVEIGVSFFKQDDPYPRMISSTALNTAEFIKDPEGSQTRFNNSIKSLANSLYCETAMNEFRRITGQRTFILFNSYVSSFGSHRWPCGWAGDSNAGKGLLNAGLAGQSMVSLDMDASSLRGIHYGYLCPLALIDSWAFYDEPWLHPSSITAAHRFYSKLRNRLAPYLYSTQAQSHFTGLPMMRAMVLEYQNDSVCRNLDQQYMLGDALLVGLDSTVYLPKGEWIDYWNNERIESKGQWITRHLKGPVGGTLFAKAGSIIPMQPVTSNLQSEQPALITLDVFPSKNQGKGWIYEDDGISFDYEKDQSAKTEFTSSTSANKIILKVGQRTGKFTGKAPRAYLMQIHNVNDIKSVFYSEKKLSDVSSKEQLLYQSGKSGWWYDAANHLLLLKPDPLWKFGYDYRGEKGDTDRDSVFLAAGFNSEEKGFTCTIEAGFTSEPNIAPTPKKSLIPNRLSVTANPPERVLQVGDGSWLPKTTTISVELMKDNTLVNNASNPVILEVFDENGNLLRRGEQKAVNGLVQFYGQTKKAGIDKNSGEAFNGEAYVEGKTRFRISSPGLDPVEITIRKSPETKGNIDSQYRGEW